MNASLFWTLFEVFVFGFAAFTVILFVRIVFKEFVRVNKRSNIEQFMRRVDERSAKEKEGEGHEPRN